MVEELLVEKAVLKIYLSTGPEDREGFTKYSWTNLDDLSPNSVDELFAFCIVEKVEDLFKFFAALYKALKPGAKAVLISPYFASTEAYLDPRNKRQLSEHSLNFTSKKWREETKFSIPCDCNFEVMTGLACDAFFALRNIDVQTWAMQRHVNGAKTVHFTLTKIEDGNPNTNETAGS